MKRFSSTDHNVTGFCIITTIMISFKYKHGVTMSQICNLLCILHLILAGIVAVAGMVFAVVIRCQIIDKFSVIHLFAGNLRVDCTSRNERTSKAGELVWIHASNGQIPDWIQKPLG